MAVSTTLPEFTVMTYVVQLTVHSAPDSKNVRTARRSRNRLRNSRFVMAQNTTMQTKHQIMRCTCTSELGTADRSFQKMGSNPQIA